MSFNVNRLYVCRGVLLRAQDGQQEGSQELWEDLHHPQETFREGSPGPGAQVRRRVRSEEQERGGELNYLNKYVDMITRCQVWRVKYSLAKIRTAARELLTLDEKDPRRLFEGWY